MSTISKKSKEYIVSLLVSIVLLGGYALTKHEAFLFLYGTVAWFSVVVITGIIIWFCKVFSSTDYKLRDKLSEVLPVMNKKMQEMSNIRYGLSMASNFFVIGLLLYWNSFFVALAVMILTAFSLGIKFFLRELFKEAHEQDQSA